MKLGFIVPAAILLAGSAHAASIQAQSERIQMACDGGFLTHLFDDNSGGTTTLGPDLGRNCPNPGANNCSDWEISNSEAGDNDRLNLGQIQVADSPARGLCLTVDVQNDIAPQSLDPVITARCDEGGGGAGPLTEIWHVISGTIRPAHDPSLCLDAATTGDPCVVQLDTCGGGIDEQWVIR